MESNLAYGIHNLHLIMPQSTFTEKAGFIHPGTYPKKPGVFFGWTRQ